MRADAKTIVRTVGWAAAALLIVVAGRTLAYALQPGLSPTGQQLADLTGGPSLLAVTAVAAAIASGAAIAIVWLASLGVSERQRLEPNSISISNGVSTVAVIVHASLLFVTSSLAFAMLESYIHWQAGFGWHGLHCLVGPVHRDAIPILASLSIVTAAVLKAADHVLSWVRRVVRLLRNRPARTRSTTITRRPRPQSEARRWIFGVRLGARGPPHLLPAIRPGQTGCAF